MKHRPPVRKVGGREICSSSPAGRAEYQRRRELRWDIDRGQCVLCGQFCPLNQATIEHPNGRGMGGSKRDDSVEAIRIAHLFGNNAKGSISLERYLELPLETRIRNCKGY
jgi:hypothetical protein